MKRLYGLRLKKRLKKSLKRAGIVHTMTAALALVMNDIALAALMWNQKKVNK